MTVLLYENCQHKYRFLYEYAMESTYHFFFGYTLGDLVYASCYRRCIWTEFQGCCLCFTSEAKHQSMLNPQDTLGTSLFLLTLSFVAACIQIAYKSCMPLWQVIARHWVLEYPRVMLRKDIWHFSTSHGHWKGRGVSWKLQKPNRASAESWGHCWELSFPPKIPKR